jgi:hypothetical protein
VGFLKSTNQNGAVTGRLFLKILVVLFQNQNRYIREFFSVREEYIISFPDYKKGEISSFGKYYPIIFQKI